MAKFSSEQGIRKEYIVVFVLTLVFAGIYGVLIWLMFMQMGYLNECETSQSVFCPTLLCNGSSTANLTAAANISTALPSNICFPYAFRLTSPDATNSPGETRFECNFPLTGEMYTTS